MFISNSSKELHNEIVSALLPMKRRKFLTAVIGSGVMLGTGSLLGACSKQPEPEFGGTKALTSDQAAFFSRFAEVVLPTEGTNLVSRDEVPIIANLDHLFANLSSQVRSDLSSAVELFEHAGLVLGWHFSRFSRMDNQEALEYIDSWHTGFPMQQGIVMILKKLVYAAYWRDKATWPPLEFNGPVSEQWGIPSLGEAPLPSRVAQENV